MKDPVGNMVVVNQVKNLSLIDIPRIRRRMKNTIGIYRVVLPMAVVNACFRMPPDGILTPGSQGRKEALFPGI
jgi:hypothetical protein